jgi:regulator of sigma E protease
MDWLLSLGTFGKILNTIILVIEVLLVFNLMILVHEWGHFLAARWRGLYVDRFQIWFGKPLWKKTINGVQYGLGCIPAGGFVSLPQMAPMEAIEGNVDTKEPLPPITPLDKIIVAFAGPLFSFCLAALFAFLVSWLGKPETEPLVTTTIGYVAEDSAASKGGLKVGDKIIEIDDQPIKRFEGFVDSVRWAIIASEGTNIVFKVDRPGQGLVECPVPADAARVAPEKASWFSSIFKRPPLKDIGIAGKETPMVGQVQENSPAAEAGLQSGDQLLTLNGQPIYNRLQISEAVQASDGKPIALTIRRAKTEQAISITPRLPDKRPEEITKPMLGIVWHATGKREINHPGVGEQLSAASRSMVNMIQKLFSPKSDISPAHMSGPVGIGRVYYNLLQDPDALLMVLWFSVVLNVNLAIMNMLPFPVLDGGHITMAIAEWIRRKPLQGRILEAFQTACALMLFGFLIFVTLKDAGDLFLGGSKKDKASPAKPGAEIQWLPKADRK